MWSFWTFEKNCKFSTCSCYGMLMLERYRDGLEGRIKEGLEIIRDSRVPLKIKIFRCWLGSLQGRNYSKEAL